MRMTTFASSLALLTALYGCDQAGQNSATDAASEEAATEETAAVNEDIGDLFAGLAPVAASNDAGAKLLSDYDGPYGGVPHFDEMSLDGIKPAFEAGMERNLAEVDAIADNPEPATFANTIIAFEKTGLELGNAFTYWGIWSNNNSSPEFREIQQEMAPKLSEFTSKIIQNEKLFARVRAVYEGEGYKTLRADQQRLVWLTYDRFASNGATLEGDAKARYAEINSRLAELHTTFSNNVLADEEGYVTYISADQLGGLPDSFVRGEIGRAHV